MAVADLVAAKDRVQAIQEVSQVAVRTTGRREYQDGSFEMAAALGEALSVK